MSRLERKILENRMTRVLENSEILDKRAYFTVSGEGDIKRKEMNLTLGAMFFCEDEKLFDEILEKESCPKEREKKLEIARMASMDIEKIKENFPKLIIKGELDFAKRYGKEFAMREPKLFLETLFNLSLMDNINFRKPLMALVMKECLDKFGWIDEIGYLVISYFTKQRYDLNSFENALEFDGEIELKNIFELKIYKKVLESFEFKNRKKYLYILNEANKKIAEKELNEVEKDILKNIEG